MTTVTSFWTEASGWIAAMISCLSFGSFAVPIKSKQCLKHNIDPLVFQTYKTVMCLLTSWIVIPLFGTPFYYTPWGIISGLFWVPAGVAAIFAVKNAGLAVSQGLWSSIIVIVSFTWGIFVFKEQVKSIVGALLAVGFMIAGLWGMSFYSSPMNTLPNYEQVQNDNHHIIEGDDISFQNSICSNSSHDNDNDDDQCLSYNSPITQSHHIQFDNNNTNSHDSMRPVGSKKSHDRLSPPPSSIHLPPTQCDNNYKSYLTNPTQQQQQQQQQLRKSESQRASIISRRSMGLMAAVFNGLWGGSIMVPMHYAPDEAHGMGYVISFAIGATIITLLLWIARFGYYYFYQGMTVRGSFNSLPPFHFRVMWKPGCTAGLLWSLGNVCSMVSVQQLGEGVGYSLTQASMLISGLWGVFIFREVEGLGVRIKWFVSAVITITGILMLSFEHV